MCSQTSRFPKWVRLEAGAHDLRFLAGTLRTRSTFDRAFDLSDGDVLVVICDPIETKWFWEERQPANLWYIGILTSADQP